MMIIIMIAGNNYDLVRDFFLQGRLRGLYTRASFLRIFLVTTSF